MHVGDSIPADVEGARGAGITPVFVQRTPGTPPPDGVPVVGSLAEAAAHVQSLLGSEG